MSGVEGEEREKQIHGGQKGRVQGQDARECSGCDETCTWTSGDGGSGDMKCPCETTMALTAVPIPKPDLVWYSQGFLPV